MSNVYSLNFMKYSNNTLIIKSIIFNQDIYI